MKRLEMVDGKRDGAVPEELSAEQAGTMVAYMAEQAAVLRQRQGEQARREMDTLTKTPSLTLAAMQAHGDRGRLGGVGQGKAKKKAMQRMRRAAKRDVIRTMMATSPFWASHPGAAKQAAHKAIREATKGR